jgi:serine/threonine protein kinase
VDMANGLASIHAAGLMHGMLYPENIFIKYASRNIKNERPVACLGGFEVMVDQGTATGRQLPADHPAARYAAPELVQQSAKFMTASMDVYSFGVVSAYVLTCGKEVVDVCDALSAVITANQQLRNMVQQCLDATASVRPTMTKVLAQLTEISNGIEDLDGF